VQDLAAGGVPAAPCAVEVTQTHLANNLMSLHEEQFLVPMEVGVEGDHFVRQINGLAMLVYFLKNVVEESYLLQ